MSIEVDILDAFKARIETLSWPTTVAWERIRLTVSDFSEFEIPVVQMYVLRIDSAHQVQTLESTMSVVVEIVLKQSFDQSINARDIWEKVNDVKNVIGTNANLDVPGVFHCRMVSRETDLYSISPYYYGRLEFEVIFKEPYTRNCP
jgi:hypothetical protein